MSGTDFDWADPFRLESQLTEEERAIRGAARAFARERLLPGIVEAYAEERSDPSLFTLLHLNVAPAALILFTGLYALYWFRVPGQPRPAPIGRS